MARWITVGFVLLVTLASIFIVPGNPVHASTCSTAAYSGRIKERQQTGKLLIELKSEEYSSASEAQEAGEKYLWRDLASVRFDDIYTDHSEDDLAVTYNLEVLGALDWENVYGLAAGFWVEGKTLHILFVTKAVNTGGPSGTSRHVMEVAELLIKAKSRELGEVLEESQYLNTTWKESSGRELKCR